MWVQVTVYVVRRARLPLGPLKDDDEVRKNLAVRVLERLERRHYEHTRSWRERQRKGQDPAPWWGFVQVLTWTAAIDLARGSRRQLAPRGKPFEWARELPMDPIKMDDCSYEQLRDFFVELQHVLRDDEVQPGPSQSSSKLEAATSTQLHKRRRLARALEKLAELERLAELEHGELTELDAVEPKDG